MSLKFVLWSSLLLMSCLLCVPLWLSLLVCLLCNLLVTFSITAMAGLAPEGSQFDDKQYDKKMQEIL
jgi:hypothetical protein